MKGYTKWYLFYSLILTLLLFLISGCSTGSPSWKVYEGSAVEKSFPVPKEANKSEAALSKAKMSYVRYTVPGLKENSDLPVAYEKEIEAWGWTEDKQEKSDSTRVFKKNKQVIQLSLQKNSFVIYVPKADEPPAVHSLDDDDNP